MPPFFCLRREGAWRTLFPRFANEVNRTYEFVQDAGGHLDGAARGGVGQIGKSEHDVVACTFCMPLSTGVVVWAASSYCPLSNGRWRVDSWIMMEWV